MALYSAHALEGTIQRVSFPALAYPVGISYCTKIRVDHTHKLSHISFRNRATLTLIALMKPGFPARKREYCYRFPDFPSDCLIQRVFEFCLLEKRFPFPFTARPCDCRHFNHT